jgi:hypothetical protein
LHSQVAPAGYGTVWSISPVIAWAPQPGAQQRAVRARIRCFSFLLGV